MSVVGGDDVIVAVVAQVSEQDAFARRSVCGICLNVPPLFRKSGGVVCPCLSLPHGSSLQTLPPNPPHLCAILSLTTRHLLHLSWFELSCGFASQSILRNSTRSVDRCSENARK